MLHLILACLPFVFVGLSWKDIWSGVSDAAGSISRTLTRWLQQLANNIWDRLGDVAQTFWNTGAHIVDNLWERVGHLMQLIWNTGDAIWRGIVYALGGLANIIHDALTAVKDAHLWAIGALGNIVFDALGKVKDAHLWALGALGNVIHDIVSTAWKGLAYSIGGLVNAVADAAGNLVHAITDAGGNLAQGIGDAAEKVEDLPEAAVKSALDHKEELASILIGGPAGLLVLKSVQELDAHKEEILHALRIDGKDIQSFAGDAFDEILKIMTGTGRIEPEDAPGQIARALGVATAFGVAARVPGIIQGFIPTEDPTATSDLAAFLAKFSGWDAIIEAGLGTATSLAIRRPMDSLLNKRSLSNEPRTGDATALYSRRFIDDATFDETMHRDGYPDDWGVPFREASYRPLRKYELLMLAAAVDLPDNVLTTFLERAGYAPEVIPILADGLHAATLKTASTARLAQARAAFADGFMDLPTFRAVMDDLGLTPAEQDLWVLAAQLDYSNGVKTELLAAYRSAAGRDALSDDELRAACAQLGLTSDKIEVEVARAQAARLKKPVDPAAREQEAAVNKARATMTEAYLLQYRKGALDEQTLLSALAFIGVPDVQARAAVALAKAQLLTPPASVPVDTPEMVNRRALKDLQDAYVLQFQHDILSAEDLRSALIGAEMAPAEADAVTLREQARKTPSPVVANRRTEERVTMEVQQTLASAYIMQYHQGFITADELESALVGAGIDPRAARSRRLLEESKAYGLSTKARATTEAQAADQLQRADQTAAVEAYRKGLIDADTLQSGLEDIGLARDLAAAITAYEEIHALPAPKATTTPA